MKELYSAKVLLKNELMTTVRLTTGGVCSVAGLSLDESEDCKVCVTESLLLLMHCGFDYASVRFFDDEGVKVEITGECPNGKAKECVEDEISIALLSALTENVNLQKEDGCLYAIGFRFGNGR